MVIFNLPFLACYLIMVVYCISNSFVDKPFISLAVGNKIRKFPYVFSILAIHIRTQKNQQPHHIVLIKNLIFNNFPVMIQNKTIFFIFHLPLNLPNNFLDLRPEDILALYDLGDLGVEFLDVNDLPGVLGLHIGGDGQVVLLLPDLLISRQVGEVGLLGPAGEGVYDALDVLRRQLIVIGDLDALLGGVDKQGLVVPLVLFQHHDAGGDGGAKKQVAGQLDHAVDEVVVNEILPDLLLRPGTEYRGSRRWRRFRWEPARRGCA